MSSTAERRSGVPAGPERRETGRVPTRRPVLVVQHLEPEGPALIADALDRLGRLGRPVDVVRVDRGEPLPADLSGHAGLVVMGGPMSAGSDDGFPTRQHEVELLRRAVSTSVPTLGVCLGAQLLAVAGGGTIERTGPPEIGWGEVQLTDAVAGDPLFQGPVGTMTVLHWHGETFTLPAGAVLLASSDRYDHQAFRLGECAWGLQFHLEVDAAAVQRFVDSFGQDAEDPQAILREAPQRLARSEARRTQVLERFASLVAGGDPAASVASEAGSSGPTLRA